MKAIARATQDIEGSLAVSCKFTYPAGRPLNPGWAFKDVAVWQAFQVTPVEEQVTVDAVGGLQQAEFVARLDRPKHVDPYHFESGTSELELRLLVLEGPDAADWREAFRQ